MHGAVKRVRPKAMTVFAAFMGLLPIMWSTGTSSPSILPEMSSGSCSRLAGTGEVHRLLPKSPAAVTGKPPASSGPPLAMRAGVPLVPPR